MLLRSKVKGFFDGLLSLSGTVRPEDIKEKDAPSDLLLRDETQVEQMSPLRRKQSWRAESLDELKYAPVSDEDVCRKNTNSTQLEENLKDELTPKKQPNLRLERTKAGLRIFALVVLITAVSTFLILLFTSNSVQNFTIQTIEWLEHLPIGLSAGLMILLYAICLVIFCPGTPFNLAAGFLYDIYLGSGVALGGAILGSIFAFFCGRTIAREWVTKKISLYPKFKAVDRALHKKGLYIVALTRLSPLFPFPLLNYAFGITKINFLSYLIGTSLGIFPATVAYTYLGTLMRNLADMWTADDEDDDRNILWLILGGLASILSIVVITFITKRAIANATKEYEELNSLRQTNEKRLTSSSTSSSSSSSSSPTDSSRSEHEMEVLSQSESISIDVDQESRTTTAEQ